MKLKMYSIHLAIAKPFLRIGNWFHMKHVQALHKQQAKEGVRRL
jgi:hypothetical protein